MKKWGLSLLEVYGIKFEAVLVVIILYMVDIDAFRLNIMEIICAFFLYKEFVATTGLPDLALYITGNSLIKLQVDIVINWSSLFLVKVK